ncbi:anti-sigma factor RsiW [Tumebacillus sp. BK434]|uniref:anti-sigma factor family protein n=1 Tax=Tumebacillus sp. BK434 TaxID=2512169 RepID=UPI001045F348|nr:zf-HC2 domain-containing protein [Tumebacillus sp. BK434]TCP52743.1 anti-sigma factor RsiW [Tumebacillus sp. BK434]
MNQCPQEERIQSYLDGELSRDERKELARHLDHCALCTQTLHELKRLAAWSDEALQESLSPLPLAAEIDVEAAWEKFQARLAAPAKTMEAPQAHPPQPKRSWFTMAKKYQKWAAGTVAAAVVLSVLTIPQVQAAAGDLLSIFRVNKIESVKINSEELRSIEQLFYGTEGGEKTIKGLGTFTAEQPQESQSFESPESMKAAGFPVVPAPQGYAMNAGSFHPAYTVQMELDTVKANKMLQQIGAGVQFDNKLDGKKFSLTLPETTSYHFSKEQSYFSYQVIGALQLDVPADVDVEELRRTILASPLIPSGVSKQLASIKDWKSTLPIPLIEGQDKVEDVTVAGHKGLFIQAHYGDGGTLVWEKDGKIHMLESYIVTETPQDGKTQEMKAFLLETAKLYN